MAGQADQVVDQVVDQVAGQVDRVDRGVGQEVDKMVEDEVGEIDQEAGATNGILTEYLIICQCELVYFCLIMYIIHQKLGHHS